MKNESQRRLNSIQYIILELWYIFVHSGIEKGYLLKLKAWY